MIDLISDLDIAEIISTGAGKPVTIARILADLGLPLNDSNKRGVKAAVRRLVIDKGLPIASSKKAPAGYRWCVSVADREDGARVLVTQAVEMLKRARSLVKPSVIREWLGQETIFGGPDQSLGQIQTQEKRL